MSDKAIVEIRDILSQIEQDYGIPRNIRIKIKSACIALEEKSKSLAVRIDRSLQELDDISDDPNIPIHTRTQIWSVVSKLESI